MGKAVEIQDLSEAKPGVYSPEECLEIWGQKSIGNLRKKLWDDHRIPARTRGGMLEIQGIEEGASNAGSLAKAQVAYARKNAVRLHELAKRPGLTDREYKAIESEQLGLAQLSARVSSMIKSCVTASKPKAIEHQEG